MTVTRMRERIADELAKGEQHEWVGMAWLRKRTFEERVDGLKLLFEVMLAEEKIGNGS